jgi:hypothetical protein
MKQESRKVVIKKSWLFYVIGFVFLYFIVLAILPDSKQGIDQKKQAPVEKKQEAIKKPAPEPKAPTRQETIEKQFSVWNGSHKALEKLIKAGMNDPDSYKHVETHRWDMGEYILVKTTFRGKNAFGGIVTETVGAKVGIEGEIIEILKD